MYKKRKRKSDAEQWGSVWICGSVGGFRQFGACVGMVHGVRGEGGPYLWTISVLNKPISSTEDIWKTSSTNQHTIELTATKFCST